MNKWIMTILATAIAIVSFSQKNELSALVTMEKPQGNLGTIYSAGSLFQFTYSRNTTHKRKLKSLGVSVGYMSMSPLQSIITYQVPTNIGPVTATESYSTYRSYQLMFSMKSGRQLGKAVVLYSGLDAGLNYNSYNYIFHSPGQDQDGGQLTTRLAVAPKFGFIISFTKSVNLLLQGRYVFSFGEDDNESGILDRYISLGGGITCRF